MANAQQVVPQGNLNRLVASIVWDNFPQLNVTPAYLGKPAISLAFNGRFTTPIETQTGLVQSPEPFVMTTLTIALLRTQPLAGLYQQQAAQNTVFGNCTVRPDVSASLNAVSPFEIQNVSWTELRELAFAGLDPLYSVIMEGYIPINSALWSS